MKYLGCLYLYDNSCEGRAYYFNCDSKEEALRSILKSLITLEEINPADFNIDYGNALDFITGSPLLVEGRDDYMILEDTLDDISNDNLLIANSMEYSVLNRFGCHFLMTLSFNNNIDDIGYDLAYKTLVGRDEEDLKVKLLEAIEEMTGIEGSSKLTIKQIVKQTNKATEPKNPDCLGIELEYKILKIERSEA